VCRIEEQSSEQTQSRVPVAQAAATFGLVSLGAYYVTVPVFRDVLQAYFDINAAQLGLLLSIGSVPGALASAAAGVLVDRWGPRRTMRLALLALAVGCGTTVVAMTWFVMLVAMAAFYAGAQALFVTAQAYLARLFPRHRRRVLSLCLVMMSLGGVLFPLWAELLLHARAAWGLTFAYALHGPFAVLAVVFLAAALLFRGATAPVEPSVQPEGRRKWLSLPTSPMTWWLLALMTVHGTADSALGLWMARVLGSGSYSNPVFAPGIVMAAYSFVYVVSRLLLAMSRERFGGRLMLIAPGLVGGGFFLAGLLSRSQALTGAGYVLGAFCWSLEFPVMLAMVADQEHRRFGSVLALCALGQGVGTFLLTNVMGWLAMHVGESGLWIILLPPAACFPMIGLGGLLYVLRFGSRLSGGSDDD